MLARPPAASLLFPNRLWALWPIWLDSFWWGIFVILFLEVSWSLTLNLGDSLRAQRTSSFPVSDKGNLFFRKSQNSDLALSDNFWQCFSKAKIRKSFMDFNELQWWKKLELCFLWSKWSYLFFHILRTDLNFLKITYHPGCQKYPKV